MLLSEVHRLSVAHMGSDSKPQSLGAESDTAHQVWGVTFSTKARYVTYLTPCSTDFPKL